MTVEIKELPKVVIKNLVPQPKMLEHEIEFKTGEAIIKANITWHELLFFYRKWYKKTKCLTKESFVNFLRLYGANGIDASIPTSELPKGHIRKIKAVSNSALTRLKDELIGRTKIPIGRKGVFGSCFHELILEPNIYSLEKFNLRPSEIERLHEMQKALANDSLTQKILKRAGNNLETLRTWIDPITGLKCKGKLDIEIPELQEATDLKTTAARSQREYEDMMNDYDYDRQGAFYATGAKAKRFRFIGVQKIAPFNVYHYAFDQDSDFMKRGKKKMNFLLQKYKEHKT